MARILVADDEDSVREFVVRAMEHFGHEVTSAADGGEALALLKTNSFDLLLADIVMPVMDGIALALKCGASFPGVKIILMTGYIAEKQRAYNLDSLISKVISKPFTLDEIGEMVAEALRSDG